MKGIMISAPNSNSGKTIVSSALLYSLKKEGLNISAFKTGPDQVDRKILEIISGKRAGNLDPFMMGQKGMEFSLNISNSEYALIEGVMGCFDGIGSTSENSSFDTAEKIGSSIVLVYAPQGEMFTIIPKLKGMIDFSKNRIRGIIFNKTNPKLYPIYKKMIEGNLDLQVLGFFPKIPEFEIEESGLGLDIDERLKDKNFLDVLYKIVKENIDIQKLLNLFQPLKTGTKIDIKKTKARTAIAMDEAFNLYYSENIFLLKKSTEVSYFSPLKDTELPDCDFLYFGSGQINKYKEELSKNIPLKTAVKKFAENGGRILAEGEALSYLFEDFDGFKMCGIFKGSVGSTSTLQNFGYKQLEFTQDCILGKKGTIINAAEYHKSKASTVIPPIFTVKKPYSNLNFKDAYAYKNCLALFQNIHFIYNLENFYDLIHK
ncbi:MULTISPECIES: cobyrinate a,c-diamide synthase [unclassified Treponema]|uniref:cobyrinate a,c-diamide synthase n=1 Tax=unclassified Treponema TaxID=2638727 RepID=UPI0020A24248|nr:MULTISPECIES: cobyrinate a,c-diamide synthase [unclassified Treponema]UTC67163.1 cobyrinate a,c-diamide synthase [Treponema sp. OMZ 789]UTC69893.1 cobyrinate a,c-diamide synthase [Treponema sp. OMZ 790]UTC72608.1 cobyrinate a,c-diamide synthase [Treponema sp. OMZ 791]